MHLSVLNGLTIVVWHMKCYHVLLIPGSYIFHNADSSLSQLLPLLEMWTYLKMGRQVYW